MGIILTGPIMRVSPNEMSFSSPSSWKAIYGHPPAGQRTLIKSKFYDLYGSGFERRCVGSERDPQIHKRMRTSLAPAFSSKALSEQETIVDGVINAFLSRIGADGNVPGGINMTKWFEMVAFDILGEMTFGESFHCIESGAPHFWQEMVVEHLYLITLADNLQRFWLVPTIAKAFAPFLNAVRDKHSDYTRQKVKQRLNSTAPRQDILAALVGKANAGEIEFEEMNAHASTLIIAGAETVATFLAATTYYLLKNNDTYSKARHEVRQHFKTFAEIDATSAQRLPYLQAVINEGLRIYPPGSQGFPRISSGTYIDDCWIPAGVWLPFAISQPDSLTLHSTRPKSTRVPGL